jgi:ATP-binding cassette subfamily A (ABC1) protein 3
LRCADKLADSSDTGWATRRSFPEFEQEGPRYNDVYKSTGFVTLQHAVDLAIIAHLHPTGMTPQASVRAKSFPFPEYVSDTFFVLIRSIVPLILVLSYIYTAMTLTRCASRGLCCVALLTF